MREHKTENYIGNALKGDARKNAAHFIEYLLESRLQLERGQGYWADKIYWMVKHNGDYVCFILINGGDDKTETEHDSWVIWIGDNGSSCLTKPTSDERLKEIAWKHIDICGNCGGCKNPGGSRKTLFGKEYDNVCITPTRFDNPDAEVLGHCRLSSARPSPPRNKSLYPGSSALPTTLA